MPTCVITGCSRGLGLEFVRQYASDGWSVIATCRNPSNAPKLAALVGDITIRTLDVADFDAVSGFGDSLAGRSVDLLINNAGLYGPRNVAHDGADERIWQDVFTVNTIAPLRVCATLAGAVARSDHKRMVTLTSKMGSIADNTSGGAYIYRSTKAALNSVMKSLSHDLRPQGITVAVFHPGWVRTDMGGPSALIDTTESVTGMRRVIASLNLDDSGRFFNYDGREVPW